MDGGTTRRVAAAAADDQHWASEDISVLKALLETPTSHDEKEEDAGDGAPRLSRASSSSVDDGEDGNEFDSASTKRTNIATTTRGGNVVVTALKRQVQLLQQEYDRHLEQRVAKSVVAAGGRSAPRASTIKLYRQYERLARVAASLEIENQRLGALLADRHQQTHGHESSRGSARRDAAPFRVIDETNEAEERIPWRQRSMFDADAKQPATRRPREREEMPGSSSEEK